MVSELKKSVDGLVLEVIIALRLFSTHAVDYLNVEPDRGVLFFAWRILSQNESKVKVEKVAVFGYHQVLKVAISNRKQVGSDGITSAGPQVSLQNLFLSVRVTVQRSQVVLKISITDFLSSCDCLRRDKLKNSVIRACC